MPVCRAPGAGDGSHGGDGSVPRARRWSSRRLCSLRPHEPPGDAYDNALAGAFFATLECELLDRRRFRSQAEVRMAVFHFIEGFYNPTRRHSSLGYLSPIEFEARKMLMKD